MQKFHDEIKGHIDHEFTSYERKVDVTGNPSTKWLASPMTDDYYATYYTGVVYHVIEDDNKMIWIGVSRCSKRDTFSKKIGRAIAKGRAEKAYAQHQENLPNIHRSNLFNLKQIEIKTSGFLGKAIQGYTYCR